MVTAQIALSLSGLWMLAEVGLYAVTYSRDQARRHDRRTLALMIALTGAATLVALVAWARGWGRFPSSLGVLPLAGLASMGAGLTLRWASILTLRRFFTINVAVLPGHRLVTHGPYRYLRHPSYTGTLTCLFGIGLALENLIALLILVGAPLVALLMRIRVEESVLRGTFGPDYDRYCQRTARLLPGVF